MALLPKVILFLLLFALNGTAIAGQYNQEITITTQNKSYVFNVELATTNEQYKTGLMFRKKMPLNAGMLFDYTKKPPRKIYMWMQNTYIPLDILFLNKDGKIISIAKNTKPLSQKVISSKAKISAALEINSGLCDQLNIQEGDYIKSPIFK